MKLSRDELLIILDIIDSCLYVASEEEVVRIVDVLQTLIPFKGAIIAVLKPNAHKRISVQKVINHSFDKRWVAAYIANDFINIDPVVACAIEDKEPFVWHRAYQSASRTDTKLKQFINVALDFKLTNGIAYAHSTSSPNPVHTILSMCLTTNVRREHYVVVKKILPHLHQAVQRVVVRDEIAKSCRSLTAREIAVLMWAKEGKTAWEMGKILFISERTVKFHLNNAYEKLNVVNRSQAVAKALNLNII